MAIRCGASGGQDQPERQGNPGTAVNKDQDSLQQNSYQDCPPYSALHLVLSDHLKEPPSAFFHKGRLVNKTFRSAVNTVHPPYTWHLQSACLNTELQTVLQSMSAEQGFWQGVKNVRLNGGDVSMTEEDCQLLVAALGARAWESVSLIEVRPTIPRVNILKLSLRPLGVGCLRRCVGLPSERDDSRTCGECVRGPVGKF